MKVTVQLNGVLSSQCQWQEREFTLDQETTVERLKQHIEANDTGIDFAAARAYVAVNQAFADDQTKLNDGDRVAFFPPLAGG